MGKESFEEFISFSMHNCFGYMDICVPAVCQGPGSP